MKIGITGSSGFIGNELTQKMLQAGHAVVSMQRSQPKEPPTNTEYFPFDIKSPTLPEDIGLDVLIHCAVVTQSLENPNAYKENVEASLKLRDYCREKGIHFVFLSTMSAHDQAVSVYGKHKFDLEQQMDAKNETVLKLGLVLGSTGGLFNNIRKTIENSSMIPLVNGGTQPIQTVAIYNLCDVVLKVVNEKKNGFYIIGHPQVHTLKELYACVSANLNRKPKFVSLPYGFFSLVLGVAETLRVKLPVGRENLLGLKQLRSFDTHADLNKLGVQLDDMETAVRRIINKDV